MNCSDRHSQECCICWQVVDRVIQGCGSMVRKQIPKPIREAVLDEYNHRCAVCGGDRPQIHHIDEDHDNNDPMNLIPLCPNNHLNDQHNPTRKIPIPILSLFRKYKDPAILKPQFKPFMTGCRTSIPTMIYQLKKSCRHKPNYAALFIVYRWEVIMAPRIKSLNPIACRGAVYRSDSEREKARQENTIETRQSTSQNRDRIEHLMIELLRYQEWL